MDLIDIQFTFRIHQIVLIGTLVMDGQMRGWRAIIKLFCADVDSPLPGLIAMAIRVWLLPNTRRLLRRELQRLGFKLILPQNSRSWQPTTPIFDADARVFVERERKQSWIVCVRSARAIENDLRSGQSVVQRSNDRCGRGPFISVDWIPNELSSGNDLNRSFIPSAETTLITRHNSSFNGIQFHSQSRNDL